MPIDALRAGLKIDKLALDEELIRQPSLFYEVSEAVTAAIAHRDFLKDELASIDAALDGVARAKLDKMHDKVTEAMVKGFIQTNPKHEKAFADYCKAKTEADQLLALKEAFHQRSYMLRELCSLFVANYYERSSYNSTRATDATHYAGSRQRMAESRAKRNNE